MSKSFRNKWFLLAAGLLLCLGVLGFAAYKNTRGFATDSSCRRPGPSLLWDELPGQLPSISLH